MLPKFSNTVVPSDTETDQNWVDLYTYLYKGDGDAFPTHMNVPSAAFCVLKFWCRPQASKIFGGNVFTCNVCSMRSFHTFHATVFWKPTDSNHLFLIAFLSSYSPRCVVLSETLRFGSLSSSPVTSCRSLILAWVRHTSDLNPDHCAISDLEIFWNLITRQRYNKSEANTSTFLSYDTERFHYRTPHICGLWTSFNINSIVSNITVGRATYDTKCLCPVMH
jgi:hypothetical protein